MVLLRCKWQARATAESEYAEPKQREKPTSNIQPSQPKTRRRSSQASSSDLPAGTQSRPVGCAHGRARAANPAQPPPAAAQNSGWAC
eukprot:1639377-Alexandrium_andersonii.AAC.1